MPGRRSGLRGGLGGRDEGGLKMEIEVCIDFFRWGAVFYCAKCMRRLDSEAGTLSHPSCVKTWFGAKLINCAYAGYKLENPFWPMKLKVKSLL